MTNYEYRASTQSDADEVTFDRLSAKKVRQEILALLTPIIDSSNFLDRSDKKWIFATLVTCSYALFNDDDGNLYEQKFLDESPAEWEMETVKVGKEEVIKMRGYKIDLMSGR